MRGVVRQEEKVEDNRRPTMKRQEEGDTDIHSGKVEEGREEARSKKRWKTTGGSQ